MGDSHGERLRRIHLLEELRVSVQTIKSGLAILQKSVTSIDRQYFLWMLVLSTGLERYMKVLLCLQSLDAEGEFLSESELLGFGHDLHKLNDAIAARCFNENALRRPAMKEDLDFISENEFMGEILEVLADFADARKDRYIYLNGANNPKQDRDWLGCRWEQIENRTMDESRRLQLIQEDELEKIRRHATERIVVALERYLRALARTVTLTGYGNEARSLGTEVWDFLMKRDDQLGTTDYEIC